MKECRFLRHKEGETWECAKYDFDLSPVESMRCWTPDGWPMGCYTEPGELDLEPDESAHVDELMQIQGASPLMAMVPGQCWHCRIPAHLPGYIKCPFCLRDLNKPAEDLILPSHAAGSLSPGEHARFIADQVKTLRELEVAAQHRWKVTVWLITAGVLAVLLWPTIHKMLW